jgi:hypothetical protein
MSASAWRVRQVLSDPEQELSWALDFELDLNASRAQSRPVLRLCGVGESGT